MAFLPVLVLLDDFLLFDLVLFDLLLEEEFYGGNLFLVFVELADDGGELV